MRYLISLMFLFVYPADAQQLPHTLVRDVKTGKMVFIDEAIGRGRVTLISFWATWCNPGKREVKTIAAKLDEWRKRFAINYIAVAVDQQHNEELVRPFVQKHGWKFPVYIDANSDLKRALNFNALPYILIIDKSGRIVFTHTGYDDGTGILSRLKEINNAK